MNCRPLVLMVAIFVALADPAGGQDDAGRPELRDLNGHFPFTVPDSADQWQKRAEVIRLQTRIALGLHPMPRLADPVPTIHGRRQMDGYSVEKVILESLPGLFVTGNLYRPAGNGQGKKGQPSGGEASQEDESAAAVRRPAVLYAHGHWDNGRFYQAPEAQVRRLLATGAERFENAAINHMQAACVQLARMGCVVFQYDMLGYADSQQVSFGRAHRFGLQGPNPPTTDEGWPLFSPEAEGYSQSIMGLQTLNTLQSLEMLIGLPDVDPQRIAITGASGGGTQSFIASAVEPRLAGAMPAVMVSTGMQGGCVCENACGLRIDTGNIELAALTAPRPLAMTTADDWTKTMPEDGFPELVQLYQLMGAPKAVDLFTGAHFPHNYNHVTRVALYGWINRLFGLKQREPILERDFELLGADELTVWDDGHPAPPNGVDFERALCAAWADQIDAALRPAADDSPQVKAEKRQLLMEGWRSITRWSDLTRGHLDKNASLIEVTPSGSPTADGKIAVHLHGGRASDHAASTPPSDRSVAAAWSLSVRDPLGEGESNDEAPLVDNPRPAAAYTYGYNPPPLVRRLGVLLDALDRIDPSGKQPVELVAEDDQIMLAALAAIERHEAPISLRWVTASEPDAEPFREVASIRAPHFIPGSLRYQGLPGLLELIDDRVQRVAP